MDHEVEKVDHKVDEVQTEFGYKFRSIWTRDCNFTEGNHERSRGIEELSRGIVTFRG